MASIGSLSDAAYYVTYSYNADGGIDKEILNNNSALYRKTCQYRYKDPRGRLTADSSDMLCEFLTYTRGSFDNSG